MRPIDELGVAEACSLDGLLFDLDDTFLDHGRLTEAAYSALFRLRESGLATVAVTGRPAAWGAVIARQWPIVATLTENGTIAFWRKDHAVQQADLGGAGERTERLAKLSLIVSTLRRELPELEPTDDVEGRISDFTFDIGERHRVAESIVLRAIELAHRLGARTRRSTVHLHLTLDGDDKASGSVRLLARLTGVDPTAARFRYAFIGDSENDESCFAAFHTTIAVSNLSGRPSVMPRFVTRQRLGAGFCEAAAVLIARRNA